MEKHVNVIAALQIGLSVFGIIIGIIGFVVLRLVGNFVEDPNAQLILPTIANIALIFFILMSIPGIIAGLGLFGRKEWARILTLILAVINLMNFPVGTAVGVYSIWALSQTETIALFNPPKNLPDTEISVH